MNDYIHCLQVAIATPDPILRFLLTDNPPTPGGDVGVYVPYSFEQWCGSVFYVQQE